MSNKIHLFNGLSCVIEDMNDEVVIPECVICGTILKQAETGYDFSSFGYTGICTEFRCPHIGERWHEQKALLTTEKDQTHSPSLKMIIQKDIDNIVCDIYRI